MTRSPGECQQRHGLARQLESNHGGAFFNPQSLRPGQRGQSSGLFQLRVLLRRQVLWRSEAFPRGESVAVIFVDAEVLELRLAAGEKGSVLIFDILGGSYTSHFIRRHTSVERLVQECRI